MKNVSCIVSLYYILLFTGGLAILIFDFCFRILGLTIVYSAIVVIVMYYVSLLFFAKNNRARVMISIASLFIAPWIIWISYWVESTL